MRSAGAWLGAGRPTGGGSGYFLLLVSLSVSPRPTEGHLSRRPTPRHKAPADETCPCGHLESSSRTSTCKKMFKIKNAGQTRSVRSLRRAKTRPSRRVIL